jgi:hypothetical protein
MPTIDNTDAIDSPDREAHMDASHNQLNTLASPETADGEFWGQLVGKKTAALVEENDSDPQALAASAVAEIDKLMGDLVSAREYLVAQAERVKRETARLNNLSETAIASVHIISDNFRKWQQDGKQAAGEIVSQNSKHDEGAHVAQARNGKEADGAKVPEVQGRRGKTSAP